MKRFIILALMMVSWGTSTAIAGITPDQITMITAYIKAYDSSWTNESTIQMLNEASYPNQYNSTIAGDKGVAKIIIIGETVLLNGKDITGNLGNKTTYGDNSPIIETNQIV